MTEYSPGDTWDDHYRGYELRINNDEDVWWQVYNGTDRLHLEPHPTDLVEQFLELKPLGGRVRVTDGGAVIARQEDEDVDGARSARTLDDYTSIYVGELELDGELVPKDDPSYSVPIQPSGLSTGDLWPSVYDGARYSFSMDGRAWWQNPRTNKRHPISGGLAEDVKASLTRQKPEGGSFRVTPWGDVITLVRSPASQTVREQFEDLPQVVQNIIKLRRERMDLQMIPIYVGQLSELPIEVEERPSLTDELTPEERESLEGWAASLGSTSSTDTANHTVDTSPGEASEASDSAEETASGSDETDSSSEGAEAKDDELPIDDPVAWVEREMDETEKRINDR